jgi:stage III sporulation protein AG
MGSKNQISNLLKRFKGASNLHFKDPKKIMMNFVIIILCGVLIILIGDISSNLSSKKETNKTNSIQVDANGSNNANENTNTNTSSSTQNGLVLNNYEEVVKKELVDTLTEIDGVGRVSAMIYFEGGTVTIPAFNINNSDKETQEKDTTGGTRITKEHDTSQNIVMENQGGDSKPFMLKQNNPIIGGVVIVAEGAEDYLIRQRLQLAVKTVLNVPLSKISIMPMKKSVGK